MRPIDLSHALVPTVGQERTVREGFWRKVRRTMGRAPFVDRAVAAYFAAIDKATPAHAKATLFAALAYFVVPADLIPDFIAGVGFSDDGAVLFMAINALAPYITEEHVARARSFLTGQSGRDRHRFDQT